MNELVLTQHKWIILALIVWQLPWKGLALWRAARLNQRAWFVGMLLVQTLGILEMVYLFYISKHKS